MKKRRNLFTTVSMAEKRKPLTAEFITPDQAAAARQLGRAISAELSAGGTVKCVADPNWWETHARPADCAGCPVLTACQRYADTGVTVFGVIAGHTNTTTTKTTGVAA